MNFLPERFQAQIKEWIELFKELPNQIMNAKNVYGDMVALDFDDSSILGMELHTSLSAPIITHAEVVDLAPGAIVDDVFVDNTPIAESLKKLIDKGKIKGKNSVIAMPSSKVVIKNIRIDAPLSEAEAEARAWQEARKAFPELVKSIFLDYAQIERPGAGGSKKFFLILVMVRKQDVSPRVEVSTQSQLTTKIIDVDYYAYERAYQLFASQLPVDHYDKYVALINFNPRNMLLLVMHNKSSIYMNYQPYSGSAILPLVQKAMGFEITSAKKPVILAPIANLNPVQETNTTIMTDEQKSHVVMAIRRLFQPFYAENPGRVIDYVAITGRCALVSELMDYVQKMLNIPTVIPNPFESLKISENMDVERIKKLGPAFALNCGLSIRGMPAWK